LHNKEHDKRSNKTGMQSTVINPSPSD